MIPGKQLGLGDIKASIRRRKWFILLPCVIAGLATFVIAKRLPNRYRSETLILVVPQRVPETYVKSTVTSRIEDRLQSISQQILSRTNLERIIQDFNLYAAHRQTRIMEDIIEQMRKDIEVQVIKGDSFRVSYTGDEPRPVMQVTQRLATLFIDENLRDREMLAVGSYQFLESQLEDARRRLVGHEKKLEEYRRKYSGELPAQLQTNLQVIQNIQLQIQAVVEATARERDRRLMLERSLGDLTGPDAATPVATAPVATADGPTASMPLDATLEQQLESARQSLRQLEIRLKPEHPDLMRLKRTVASLEQKVAEAASRRATAVTDEPGSRPLTAAENARATRIRELKADLASLERQLGRREDEERQLRKSVAMYQARVEASPSRESEMTELMRDYDTLRNAYTDLLAKKEASKVAADMERNQIGEQFKILDAARLPEKPYSPDRPRLVVIGTIAGLLLGLVVVGALEFSDATFKSDDDVMHALSLPVLALVPMMITPREKVRARRRRWAVAILSSSTAILLLAGLIVWTFRS